MSLDQVKKELKPLIDLENEIIEIENNIKNSTDKFRALKESNLDNPTTSNIREMNEFKELVPMLEESLKHKKENFKKVQREVSRVAGATGAKYVKETVLNDEEVKKKEAAYFKQLKSFVKAYSAYIDTFNSKKEKLHDELYDLGLKYHILESGITDPFTKEQCLAEYLSDDTEAELKYIYDNLESPL